MSVQATITVTSPGDSIAELLTKLEAALASTGLTVTSESLVDVLKAALAECEAREYTDEDIAALDTLKGKLDRIDAPPA